MRGAILNTDPDWYEDLRVRGPLDEVNFWQPRGGKAPKGLPAFAPVLFRLTMRRTGRPTPSGRIVGFGFYVRRLVWPAWYVWELFGEHNGVPSRAAFIERLRRLSLDANVDVERRDVGCLMIAEPTFLAPKLAVDPPADWSPRTMDFKYYDLSVGEGPRATGRRCITIVYPPPPSSTSSRPVRRCAGSSTSCATRPPPRTRRRSRPTTCSRRSETRLSPASRGTASPGTWPPRRKAATCRAPTCSTRRCSA